ncbi:Leucine-rich repeat-containing protein 57 [Hondaea fermentalgiana]|uniref:Leucine-rich repeat-containing protein 57 n=1 Tax=Hondaea fermentalgiana TaxID=2315210 RepID=A0A2R5G743_9STRA|nr:Leucine-rich repeat-containing protein 57 [Hondaea fermentalgiana]|eukprot:GBG26139.1 Leucine-rich repeat-containing protein 57 [Hondaea fermentalgiana]
MGTSSSTALTTADKSKGGVSGAVETGGKTGRLVLAKCKLTRVPAEVWLLGDRLRSLDLSGNALENLTSQIGVLTKLQSLRLSCNALQELPMELIHLSELHTLLADHNKLHTVAAVLPRQKLKKLDLSYNAFEGEVGHPRLALPPCTALANLSHNRITGFAPSFGFEALQALEELDIDDNAVQTLPPAVGEMTKLKCLKARNNQLASVPSEIFAKTEIHLLQLDGNPITVGILRETPGFDLFMARRAERINKGISQGLHPDRSICGLADDVEREIKP